MATGTPLTWEEPPSGRSGRLKGPVTEEQRNLLRAHPKRWAKVRDYPGKQTASTTAHRARKGRWPELAPEEWEFTGRRTPNGSALYARYIGPKP